MGLGGAESRDMILATLASMAEGVLMMDAKGKALLVNEALLQTLKLKKEQTAKAYYWEIFRDSEVNQMIENVLEKKKVIQKEHSILLSDKTFEIQVSPVMGGEEFLGAVAVFHDVTRLKKLEKMRTEFVANVSHELKTPLTAILGFVETLKDGAVDDPACRIGFLTTIEEHAKNLRELVEDQLFLSSIESGKSLLRIQSCDLDKILERAVSYLQFKISEKKIIFEKEIIPQPFLISVDPALFERVLINLLDNAVKYSHSGGKIGVRAYREMDSICIEIQDQGIGISESDQRRIFERFYRVDKSRSRDSGGAGLGLAITKHIIESHGGVVEVESVLQKGSKFTLRLQYN